MAAKRMGRPVTAYTGAWAKFVDAFGGPTACAKALGVARGSLDRWAAGLEPSRLYRELLVHHARLRGVPNPLEAPMSGRVCQACGGMGFRRGGVDGKDPDTLVPCGHCSIAPPVKLELG